MPQRARPEMAAEAARRSADFTAEADNEVIPIAPSEEGAWRDEFIGAVLLCAFSARFYGAYFIRTYKKKRGKLRERRLTRPKRMLSAHIWTFSLQTKPA